MDCSGANFWIESLILLIQQSEKLLWIYPFTWAIVLVRKIFYA